MIAIDTIGAGGGSLAWIDRGGFLHVGPQSAGAVPGPACYGLDGERPTVTDAHVVLGHIDAARPIGDRAAGLDVEAARAAIAREIAGPLGLTVEQAAAAIVEVTNSKLAGSLRLVSVERGHDPRDFTFLPFGGGGPLHAAALMRDVGIGRALVPYHPGLLSALGCAVADVRHDFVRTVDVRVRDLDPERLTAVLAEHDARGNEMLREEGVPLHSVSVIHEADMSYEGQSHFVGVALRGATPAEVQAAFDEAYRREFRRTLQGIPARLVTVRSAIIGIRQEAALEPMLPAPGGDDAGAARRPARRAFFDGQFVETSVYDRTGLPVGARLAGPAVIEQPDATIIVEPGMAAEVDGGRNLRLTFI
ncbi:MAG: hydantoinase/oxoprolinase family protein [Armatimonadetes bacterium]|nr:hydantoinase/oxoprolinase family protein [Armatimonadota bacterium]